MASIKFYKNPTTGSRVVPFGRPDRETDRQHNAIAALALIFRTRLKTVMKFQFRKANNFSSKQKGIRTQGRGRTYRGCIRFIISIEARQQQPIRRSEVGGGWGGCTGHASRMECDQSLSLRRFRAPSLRNSSERIDDTVTLNRCQTSRIRLQSSNAALAIPSIKRAW